MRDVRRTRLLTVGAALAVLALAACDPRSAVTGTPPGGSSATQATVDGRDAASLEAPSDRSLPGPAGAPSAGGDGSGDAAAASVPQGFRGAAAEHPVGERPRRPRPSPTPMPEPTPTPTPTPAPATGFTAVAPSADSRLVHVSSSTGSDDNDCLSPAAPCRTLAAATAKLRDGYPDHLYLQAGDVWRDESLGRVRSGRSAAEPAVVTAYGAGARPRIEDVGQQRALGFVTQSQGLLRHVRFLGLEIANVRLDADHPDFTGRHDDSHTVMFLGGHEDLLFEDMVFDHVELVLQQWEGRQLRDVTLRRSIFTGAYTDQSSYSQSAGGRPSNLYADGVDGLLIEENVFDHGGWHPTAPGAGANMYNHNLYLQWTNVGNGVVVRDNVITRASSHGVQGRAGGTFEDNFLGRNAIGLLVGYTKDHPLQAGTRAWAHGNVITEGHSMVKGPQPCSGVNLCTPALWGLELSHPGGADVSLDGNVVHSRTRAEDTLWQSFYRNLNAQGLRLVSSDGTGVTGTVVWRWASDDEGADDAYPDPGRTLGDYYAHLERTGVLDDLVADGFVRQVRPDADPFVSFLQVALERERGRWDERVTASAVNDWVRAGFGH